MEPNRRLISYFLILIFITVDIGCNNAIKEVDSPAAYDFSKPEKLIMSEGLQEISGLAFKNLNPKTIYSIQDEDGRVFSQKWGIKKAVNTKFASKGDYEDLAILADSVFVLKSNGTLYGLPISEIGKKDTEKVKEWKKLMPKGEFESLCADDAANELIVLCKNCDADKKKNETTGYVLRYDKAKREVELDRKFELNLKPIERLGIALKHGLRASALSRNPVTKEWYILSSVNKILVVADSDWQIKSVYRLSSVTFNQPEGLAFDKDQNLYISNEGDEITNGNILKFKYLKSGK